MRQCIGGNGQDTTAAVLAFLATHNELNIATLYLIGNPEDPRSIYLTDYEGPLLWSQYSRPFLPAVVTRGTVDSKVGLDVPTLDVNWSPPPPPSVISIDINTASPYQLVRAGYYDNWPVYIWTVYMPEPGDANTFGCSQLFGGNVSNAKSERGMITFTVKSFLAAIEQNVPNNVIEFTNTYASYAGATPPPGYSVIPQMSIQAGSTQEILYGLETYPTPGGVFGDEKLIGGYVVFNRVTGGTASGLWSPVGDNRTVIVGGVHLAQIRLFAPLAFAPTVGFDTFFVSGKFPLDQSEGQYFGFPFVPDPSAAT